MRGRRGEVLVLRSETVLLAEVEVEAEAEADIILAVGWLIFTSEKR